MHLLGGKVACEHVDSSSKGHVYCSTLMTVFCPAFTCFKVAEQQHFSYILKLFIFVFAKMSNQLANSYLNESSKLDGKNYINWKFKILTICEAWNVWSVVNGDELKPAGATGTDWEKRETKAKVLL